MSNVRTIKGFDPPESQGIHHRLLCMSGENKGTSYYLTGKRIVMGRSKDTDIQILDTNASKQHAELVYKKGRYILTDLKSQNGIYINNEKKIQIDLNNGDNISVGKTVFKYNIIVIKDVLGGVQTNLSKDVKKEDKAKKNNKNRPLVIILVGVMLYVFLDDSKETKSKKKPAEISNQFLQDVKRAHKKKKNDNKELERQIDTLIHQGLRELREGNHFRALEDFNHVLIISPNHDRAEFYRSKTKQQLDDEIKQNFLRAKKDVDALKYKSAAVSYCDILKLLQGYDNDQRYKDAKSNLGIVEEKMGLDSGEIKCF